MMEWAENGRKLDGPARNFGDQKPRQRIHVLSAHLFELQLAESEVIGMHCLVAFFQASSTYYRMHMCFAIPLILYDTICIYTSSTAQGGGGSVKNRKPIGEVGCCESHMAERIHWWTERWLELCFLEWLEWLQWSPGRSPHPQLLDVVWCSAAVVVV